MKDLTISRDGALVAFADVVHALVAPLLGVTREEVRQDLARRSFDTAGDVFVVIVVDVFIGTLALACWSLTFVMLGTLALGFLRGPSVPSVPADGLLASILLGAIICAVIRTVSARLGRVRVT
ncbi:MAG: hypothetical protein DI629_20690 [Mesorhizobium amorphae]|nr:MAG: hypothetical protein DI629_20690 [Mesorhizobium amorphae]